LVPDDIKKEFLKLDNVGDEKTKCGRAQ
jgi:hypothetical protein